MLGFRHLREGLFGAALHLFGSNVFDMLAQRPAMTERIGDLAVAIAPELIGQRHGYDGARLDRPIEHSVDIFRVQVQNDRTAAQGLRRN